MQIMFYPTRIVLPLWARPKSLALKTALRNLRIGEIRVKRISSEFNPRNLMRPYLFPQLEASVDPEPYMKYFSEKYKIDGTEVVEWMIDSAANNAIASARVQEYNRIGSNLAASHGDGAIPGVVVSDCRFRSEYGHYVSSRGYAVAITPRGNFNVPVLKKNNGIFRDLLTWASTTYTGYIQYGGFLAKWIELASTPIRSSVGFIKDTRGNVAPQFFNQLPPRPKMTVTVRQTFQSSNNQTISIAFRNPTDYTNVLGTKSFDVPAGTNQVSYTLTSIPYTPPVVAHIQPEDHINTTLEEFVVG